MKPDLTQMTNEELLQEYKAYDQLIHGEYSCYGLKDVWWFMEICREMDKREEA